MKVRASFINRGALEDAIEAAVAQSPRPKGLSAAEWAQVLERRQAEAYERIQADWMYGDSISIEFDLAAATATVLKDGDWK